MANVTRKEMYVKSDVNNNNNKFWEVTICDDFSVLCRWGRVGDDGQSKTFNFGSMNEANHFVDGKIKEKIRDGRNGEIAYRKIDVVGSSGTVSASSAKVVANSELVKITSTQIKTNNPIVDDLIRYLTRVNAHQITTATSGKITYDDTTGLFSTPLGLVTQANIDQANDLLVKIGDLVVAGNYNSKDMIPWTNDFLMLIPQDIGRTRLDVREFWADTTKLQYQKGILDGLQTSLISAAKITTKQPDKVDAAPVEKVFDLQLSLVDDQGVIRALTQKYESSKKHGHTSYSYKIKTIYSVKIAGERDRFERLGKPIGNIHQFFHGSSSANLLSIMKQGLIIPPSSSSHVCGRMFSDGVYFAPSSSKSLNYSIGVWGGKTADRVFMFIADVAMGRFYTPRSSGERLPKPGYDSTWAKAGESGVINDECIVYKTYQCSLIYLLELTK